jgi:hypothetical protein
MSTWQYAMYLLGVRRIQERKRNRGPRTRVFWALFAAAVPFGLARIVLVWQSRWLGTLACMIVFFTIVMSADIYRDRDYLRKLRESSRR